MDEQTQQFKKLMFRLIKKAKAHFEHELKKANITITSLQYGILAHLSKDGITLNELSNRLANKPPTLIPAIDHLEQEGYIKKDQDTEDRRKVHIVITAKGKDILKKVPINTTTDLITKGFSTLSKEKAKMLISLFEELTNNIEK